MSGKRGLVVEGGSDCNRVTLGGTTELFGDPAIKAEKPHTIILFPGGHVEIARTSDDNYWVHVAVRETTEGSAGAFVDARMDFDGRYDVPGNEALRGAMAAGDCQHIAFLVRPFRPGRCR